MKAELLKLLEENEDKYISGELISNMFSVTRAAVWKHINSLRKEGYIIESVTNKGYRLAGRSQGISGAGITAALKTDIIGKKVICLDEVDSTNNYAKILGTEGVDDGTLVIADEQHSGRGRLGRCWSSAKGKGIWMSVLLKPQIEPQKAQIITLAAAVAVVQALRPMLGERVKLKWPNDVLVDGKKLCGILTEMNCEMENVNYVVVGIGLNVNHTIDDFPKELIDTATSIKLEIPQNQHVERIPIVADILNNFEKLYLLILQGKTDKVIYNWRSFSATLGNRIRIKTLSEELYGTAEDITDEGVLLLKDDSGKIHRIFSGEVFLGGVIK